MVSEALLSSGGPQFQEENGDWLEQGSGFSRVEQGQVMGRVGQIIGGLSLAAGHFGR